MSSFFFIPADKGKLVAIGTPGRHGFCEIVLAHTLWRSIGPVHYIQSIQYGESQFLSVRTRNGIADLCRQLVTGILNGIVEIQAGTHFQFNVHAEGNFLWCCTFLHGELPDFSSIRGNEEFTVRRKTHARQNTKWSDAFLFVALHGIGQPTLFA